MKYIKKLFLFGFLALLTTLLIGCTKVDYSQLENQTNLVSEKLNKYTITDKKGNELYFDGVYYLPTKVAEEAKQLIEKAQGIVKEKKASRELVEELVKKLQTTMRKIANQSFFGENLKEYALTLQGLEEAIKDINVYLSNFTVASNKSEVLLGEKFILQSEYNQLKNTMNEIRQSVTETDPATVVDKKLFDQLKDAKAKVNPQIGKLELNAPIISDNFNLGEINDLIDPTSSKRLNLNGATITYYTHVINEDDPRDPGYKSDVVSKEKYLKFITDLETNFNCKIKFEIRKGDYFEFAENLKKTLDQNTNESCIIRVPELAALMDNIKAESIVPIDSLLNKLKENENTKDYLFSDWQRERCTIFGKSFGIQRYDGLTYPDVMIFNRGLLKKLGFTAEQMPDQIWKAGKWDTTVLQQYIKNFHSKNHDSAIKAFGLTPKFMGINAVTANGISLINRVEENIDKQLKINKTDVATVLNYYKEHIYGELKDDVRWYIPEDQAANDAYLNDTRMLANHMRDTFNDGKLGMTMVQCWQTEMGSLNDYGIVPIPQLPGKTKADYISTIEAGDILSVTRGKNHHEVSLILLLMNKFFKDNTLEFLKSKQAELNVEGDLSNELVFNELSVKYFVSKKLKYTSEDERKLSEEIVAFMHGYKTKDYKEVAKLEPSHLAQIGADEIYSLALQKALKNNAAFSSYIESQIAIIKKNYEDLLNYVLRFR